jgi:hypothetical protein
MDLREDGDVSTSFLGLNGSPQACETSADDENVVRKEFHGNEESRLKP